MLFASLLRKTVKSGCLVVIDAKGKSHRIGEGDDPVTFRLHDSSLHWRLAMNPHLYLGEAYMDGTLTVEGDHDIADLLMLLVANATAKQGPVGWLESMHMALLRARYFIRNLDPLGFSRKNVAHHYELSDRLFEMFLDSNRQYTCGYYADPEMTLEEAQLAKMDMLARKLRVEPGCHVLDIGSGWGGLAMHLAENYGARVTGITLSNSQREYAERRSKERGLDDKVKFVIKDFRHLSERYDRIVVVGMIEHVGAANYRAFFDRVHACLEQDGIAVLHTIVTMNPPARTSHPWSEKYIFPGGYTPSISEVISLIERHRMWLLDQESWRVHYVPTLRDWRKLFMSNWDEAKELYDERFCRMWEFYLAGAEALFKEGRQLVSQFQFGHRMDAAPLTRDYLYARDSGS